jgi:hypothetical protein
MSHPLPVVAIAGASGDLGQRRVASFTSPTFRHRFKEIVLLSGQPGYSVFGTTTRISAADDVASSVQGVDVVVNCVGSKGDTMAFKTALIDAIAKTQSVKMYVASEFGGIIISMVGRMRTSTLWSGGTRRSCVRKRSGCSERRGETVLRW